METSLLSILKAEAQLIENIDKAFSFAETFQCRRDTIAAIPIDCATKASDIAYYDAKIADWQQKAEEYRVGLDAVRGELQSYITNLFTRTETA